MAVVNSNNNSIDNVSVRNDSEKKVSTDLENALIQGYGAWFKVIPANYRLVEESIFGDEITIKTPGLTFVNPLKRRKLVCIVPNTMEVTFSDALNNVEGLELTLKPVVVQYHIDTKLLKDHETGEKVSGVEKFYRQRLNALNLIKNSISTLITTIVSYSHRRELKGLVLKAGELPDYYFNSLHEDDAYFVEDMVNKLIKDIRRKYGIVIDEIHIKDANMPTIITDAQAQLEKQKIENQTNIAKSKADLEVAQNNAQAERYVESVRYDVLFKYAKENGLNNDEIAAILKVQALKGANATVIQSSGGLDALVGMMMQQYYSKFGNNKSLVYDTDYSAENQTYDEPENDRRRKF